MTSGFDEAGVENTKRRSDLERYIEERLPAECGNLMSGWTISIDDAVPPDSWTVVLANCEYSRAFLVDDKIDHIQLTKLCLTTITEFYPAWKKLQ